MAAIDGPNGEKVARRLSLTHAQPGQRRIVTPTLETGGTCQVRLGGAVTDQVQQRLVLDSLRHKTKSP